MNTTNSFVPGKAIHLLDQGIRVVRYLLIFVTIVAAVGLTIAVSGRGSMTVEAHLQDPYFIEFDNGRRVGVDGSITTYENFPIGSERDTLVDVGEVGLTVPVARSDTDSRIALGLMVLGWGVATWIGLISLERLVAPAASGEAFKDNSPKLLRRLGGSLIAIPVISNLGASVLDGTLETDLPISVSIAGTPTWVLLVTGLAVFALAEVFGEAVRLRQFEEATV